MPQFLRPVAALAAAVCLAAAPVALADEDADDHDERDSVSRATGPCPGGGAWSLDLRGDGEEIRVRADARIPRRGPRARPAPHRVVVVHERRVALVVTLIRRDRVRVETELPDLPGADAVTVTVTGPRGGSCRAAARLVPPGS